MRDNGFKYQAESDYTMPSNVSANKDITNKAIYIIMRYKQGFTSVRKKTEFLDKSSKAIDIYPSFFEPKWSHKCKWYWSCL